MRRITSVSTGLMLVAGSLAFAAPAHAAVATKVTIKADHTPAYVGDEVTVTGKLTRSNGTVLKGQNILLTVSGKRKIVTTNADGLYVAEVPVPKSGTFTAEYFGTGNYADSSAATPYYSIQYRTFIDKFGGGPRPAAQNSQIAIVGRANRIAVDGDQALPGAGLDLLFSGDGHNWSYVASTTSNGYGRFRFTPIVAQDGTWKVVVKPNFVADGWLQSERNLWVDTRYRTRVSASATPKNVRYKGRIKIYGALRHQVNSAWTSFGGTRVAIYFRARGGGWKFKGWAYVGGDGRFNKKFTALKDGYWKAVYKGNGDNFGAESSRTYVNVH